MSEQKENTSGSPGLIYQQIPKIMADIKSIGKGRTSSPQQGGYAFRGIDDVYNELQEKLAKHRVFTVPTVLSERYEDRKSKSGGTLIYRIFTIKYTFYAEDGSFFDAVVIGEAMDSGDKAGNKAMSAGHKYVLLQTFCIPTDEPKDSENDTYEVNGTPKPIQQRPPADPNPIPRTSSPETSTDDGSIGALADKAEEDKAKKEGIAGAIRTKLELRTVDPKSFKAYLQDIQGEKKRKFVGKVFGNPSLTAGDLKDLRYLDKFIDMFIDNFIESSEKKEPAHVQPN